MIKKDPVIEKKIDELIAKMTVAEKVGQLNQVSGSDDGSGTLQELVRSGKTLCTITKAIPLGR